MLHLAHFLTLNFTAYPYFKLHLKSGQLVRILKDFFKSETALC